jgi:GMP synthase (glutamine-hydrolysing)
MRIAHLGTLEATLLDNGYEIHYLDVTTENPQSHPEPDLVVVLGGDLGVYERAAHPFIDNELSYLSDRLAAERPTLGICLGAQLMAQALGGTVLKGPSVEVGFRAVTPTPAGLDSPLRHIAGVLMMQWHGDTYRLPAGATRLASSEAYDNEAFSIGSFALGVQFHPELSADMYEQWIAEGAAELAELGIDEDALRREAEQNGPGMEAAAVALFSEWLAALN